MTRATDLIDQFFAGYAAERSPESASRWDWASQLSKHLDIVVHRYRLTSIELSEVTEPLKPEIERTMTDDAWDRVHELGDVLEVDVISFFVFGSIFLDMLARAVQAFGGKAQGVSLDSHHALVEHLRDYAAVMGFPAPGDDLMKQAADLYEAVNRTRNRVFVHPDSWEQLLGGFAVGEKGLATLGLTFVGSPESPAGQSHQERARHLGTPVPALVEMLDAYVDGLTSYLAQT